MVLALVNDLKERVEAVLGKEDQLQKCQDLGWMVQTETALNPSWVYFGWDSAAKKQIVLPDPPLKHAECLRQIDTLLEHLPRDGVLARFSTPKELRSCRVQPHPQSSRGLERSVPPGAQEIERMCSHETPGSSIAAGEDPEASSCKGPWKPRTWRHRFATGPAGTMRAQRT